LWLGDPDEELYDSIPAGHVRFWHEAAEAAALREVAIRGQAD